MTWPGLWGSRARRWNSMQQPPPVIPPIPGIHAEDPPAWRLLLEFGRNIICAAPNRAYDNLVIRRRVLGTDTLLVNDPDAVRHVLTAMDKYRRVVFVRRMLAPLGENGLLLAAGQLWRRERRLLAPVFSPARVSSLLPHFMSAAEDLAERLDGEKQVNLSLAFQEATLEASLRVLFSLSASKQRNMIAALARKYLGGPGRPNILDIIARTDDSFSFALLTRRRMMRVWSGILDDIIAHRRQSPAPAASRDLLDLLISARDPETGESLSDEEIRDQSSTLLVAGYETTARALFWTVYLLTLDQAEQDRLRKEIAAYPPEQVIKLEELRNWPRLSSVILEALRLYPTVPYMAREALAEDVVAGERVGPGTQIWMSPWVIHRHRKYWNHPGAFIPDRFDGKPSPWTSMHAYLPFGGGPRICIGATFAMAEIQIFLATLLSRFKIAPGSDRPVLPVASVTIAPSYEPRFGLERV
jgi:cytochrome P450